MPDLEANFPRGGEIVADIHPSKRKRTKPVKSNVEVSSLSYRFYFKINLQVKKRKEDPEYEDVFTKVITREQLSEDVRDLGFIKKVYTLNC